MNLHDGPIDIKFCIRDLPNMLLHHKSGNAVSCDQLLNPLAELSYKLIIDLSERDEEGAHPMDYNPF